jgi:hypothetical protein
MAITLADWWKKNAYGTPSESADKEELNNINH